MAIKCLELSYRFTGMSERDLKELLKQGEDNNTRGYLTKINTPLKNFIVKYEKTPGWTDFYIFEEEKGSCIAQFALESFHGVLPKNLLRKRVPVLTPHIAIREDYRGKGLARKIYLSFLSGNRVFATFEHTEGAKKLWDSLSTVSGVISFYVNEKTEEIKDFSKERSVFRVIGKKSLFNIEK